MGAGLFTAEEILSRIVPVGEHKAMLDADLARMYGVSTGALMQAVRRNRGRFPPDFMFALTDQDVRKLEITDCDFKFNPQPRLGRKTKAGFRFYRARRRNAFFRLTQHARYRSEHRDNAGVRATTDGYQAEATNRVRHV